MHRCCLKYLHNEILIAFIYSTIITCQSNNSGERILTELTELLKNRMKLPGEFSKDLESYWGY